MNAPSLPLDLYVRVSRRGKREAEAFGSPQDQLRDARHFAEAHGLPIGIELPHDIDQSGGKTERPGFQEALRRINAGESGGIIVAYQSRYSRDVLSGLQALEEIDKAGGAVYGPNIADYSTPDGKMLFTINLAIDAGYLDRKAAEFDRSKRQAIERGIPVSTRAPVGYRKVSKDDPRQDMRRRYEADPAMAPVVREAFVLRAAGKGPAEIGRFLAEHGVTTSQGGQWSKQAVYGLLANPVYKGWLSWGPYENRNAHEAIVDDALWLAAQHARLQRERPVPASDKHAYLLTGATRCAGCGYSLQSTQTSHRHAVYRCTRQHAGGKCPAPASIRAEVLEQAVLNTFWYYVEDGNVTSEPVTARDEPAVDLAPLEARLSEANAALAHARENFPGMVSALEAAREQAEQELGTARAAAAIAARHEPAPRRTLLEQWEHLTTTQRRDLALDVLSCEAVVVHREPKVAVLVQQLPDDVPRRGWKVVPKLRPLPLEGEYGWHANVALPLDDGVKVPAL